MHFEYFTEPMGLESFSWCHASVSETRISAIFELNLYRSVHVRQQTLHRATGTRELGGQLWIRRGRHQEERARQTSLVLNPWEILI